jgi:hypothetical protein
MKRSHVFFILSGVISMLANVAAILSYFQGVNAFRPDRGLLIAVTFVLMAYALASWSLWVWRRTEGSAPVRRFSARPAAFILNALLCFPLLTLWLSLLFTVVFFPALPPSERWILALGFSWGITPFAAFGFTLVGETLGPLMWTAQAAPPAPEQERPG